MAKSDPNLAGCWNSWKSQKNLKVGVFETDFKQVPFVFRQTTCIFSESLKPVENVCDLGLVHRNCLIFGTKVNLDNPYALAILKLFGKF